MHKRLDYPMQNPTQGHRLLTGGLDEIWSRPSPHGWPHDRGRRPGPMHRVRSVRRRVPHAGVRPRARWDSGDRATRQLPDLLSMRGVLPDRRAVRRAAGDKGASGLAFQGPRRTSGLGAARRLPQGTGVGKRPCTRRPNRCRANVSRLRNVGHRSAATSYTRCSSAGPVCKGSSATSVAPASRYALRLRVTDSADPITASSTPEDTPSRANTFW